MVPTSLIVFLKSNKKDFKKGTALPGKVQETSTVFPSETAHSSDTNLPSERNPPSERRETASPSLPSERETASPSLPSERKEIAK